MNVGISCYSLAESSGLQSSEFGYVWFGPKSLVSNKNKSLTWKTSTQNSIKALPVPVKTEERIPLGVRLRKCDDILGLTLNS